MPDLTWIDFFLRLIPEGLIIILAGYAVSKKDMNIKLYLLASILLALLTFVLKMLPISTVLPMILSTISTVILLVLINKIKVIYAIISTFICFILLIITEGLNILILENVFNIETEIVFQNSSSFSRNIYGLPSLLIYGLIIILYYFISKRKKAKKNVDI